MAIFLMACGGMASPTFPSSSGVAMNCAHSPDKCVDGQKSNRWLMARFIGLRDDEGSVFVALFDSAAGYKNGQAARGDTVEINDRVAEVVFADLPAGSYGISFFHDENSNGELDKNFFGIPAEGFGFSNDAMGRFGPPDYQSILFVFPEEPGQLEISMRTRYF